MGRKFNKKYKMENVSYETEINEVFWHERLKKFYLLKRGGLKSLIKVVKKYCRMLVIIYHQKN